MGKRSIAAGSRDVAQLRRRFQGQVLLPGQDGYHQARRVWNAMVDWHPAVIARCASPADVAAVVRFGRAQGLERGLARLADPGCRVGPVRIADHPDAQTLGLGSRELFSKQGGGEQPAVGRLPTEGARDDGLRVGDVMALHRGAPECCWQRLRYR